MPLDNIDAPAAQDLNPNARLADGLPGVTVRTEPELSENGEIAGDATAAPIPEAAPRTSHNSHMGMFGSRVSFTNAPRPVKL
jgi:hypothetical protein